MSRKTQTGMFVEKFLVWILASLFLIGLMQGMAGNLLKGSASNNSLSVNTKLPGTVIGFFNGVMVEKDDAMLHLDDIHARYGNKTPSGQPLQYQLFYNDSYGLMLDLIETFDQRAALIGLGDRYDLFWEWTSGSADGLRRESNGSESVLAEIDKMKKTVADQSVEYLRGLVESKKTGTSAAHRQILDRLTSGKNMPNLVFLAHSQGNLYALPAYVFARSRTKNLSLVHAAPPVDRVKGDYVLSSRDLVINSLRPLGHVLPSNVDVPPCGTGCQDMMGHGFAEVYFNPGTLAGKRVEERMEAILGGKIHNEHN